MTDLDLMDALARAIDAAGGKPVLCGAVIAITQADDPQDESWLPTIRQQTGAHLRQLFLAGLVSRDLKASHPGFLYDLTDAGHAALERRGA